jgi:hypothetical protein
LTVYQLLIIDFREGCDPVRREVLYNILTEYGLLMELVSLIKMCLNKTCNKVRIVKYFISHVTYSKLSETRRCLTPLPFNFAIEYFLRKVQNNQVGIEMNGTHRLLIYADSMNLLGNIINTTKKNTEAVTDASKEVDPEAKTEKLNVC